MDKTVIDEREKLLDFLYEEGREDTHRDYCGGYETVFTLPMSLKDKFWKLYCGCLVNRTSEFFEYYDPDTTIGRVVTGATKFTEGEYTYRRSGYDEDGFYCNGSAGVHKCKEYITFFKASVYAYHEPWRKYVESLKRDTYANGNDISKITVCFTET